MSGPAVLKLSAWELRSCMTKNISLLFVCGMNADDTADAEKKLKSLKGTLKKQFLKNLLDFPNRLWESIVLASGLKLKRNGLIYTMQNLSIQSVDKRFFSSQRKSTFKEEFVTAGMIDLKRLISKLWKHATSIFAGEIVNNAITGSLISKCLDERVYTSA
jgi:predicted flavoprotein YhiN